MEDLNFLLTTNQFLQNSSKILQKSSRRSPKNPQKSPKIQIIYVSRRSIRSVPCLSCSKESGGIFISLSRHLGVNWHCWWSRHNQGESFGNWPIDKFIWAEIDRFPKFEKSTEPTKNSVTRTEHQYSLIKRSLIKTSQQLSFFGNKNTLFSCGLHDGWRI